MLISFFNAAITLSKVADSQSTVSSRSSQGTPRYTLSLRNVSPLVGGPGIHDAELNVLNLINQMLKSDRLTSLGRLLGSAVLEILENLFDSGLGGAAVACVVGIWMEATVKGARAAMALFPNALYCFYEVSISSTADCITSFSLWSPPNDIVRALKLLQAASNSLSSP